VIPGPRQAGTLVDHVVAGVDVTLLDVAGKLGALVIRRGGEQRERLDAGGNNGLHTKRP
jgi:hypothetical protein